MPDSGGDRTGLTEVLLRPRLDQLATVGADERRLSEELTGLVARAGAGPFRLTDYTVRAALWSPEGSRSDGPFTWSAVTARRPLGLAAVRSLLGRTARSPVDAVRLAVTEAVDGVGQGRRPVSSLDQWLAGLTPAGRAALQAEVVTWATRLWTALDWGAFASPPAVGRDHWWDSPHSSLLAIRSRAEVRAATTDAGGNRISVHLVVLGGPRRATARSELSVVALVEALRTGAALPPGRIVGWWPESGHHVAVDVDQNTLAEGVDTVARAVAALAPEAAAA